jgi:formate dehydrogenase subunit gamma
MTIPGSADWDPTVVQSIIDELKSKPGALLPILHAIQNHFSYIPPEAIALIAPELHITETEIHGVISFYHHFRTHEPGRHVVEICRAEACQAQGGRTLEAHAKASLDIDYHQTSADRTVTLEPVYCLGNCACGPAVRIGNDIHAHVDAQRFDDLIDELRTDRLEIQS